MPCATLNKFLYCSIYKYIEMIPLIVRIINSKHRVTKESISESSGKFVTQDATITFVVLRGSMINAMENLTEAVMVK